MKLAIDEKLKHRLVGMAVVLSLGAIFLPAIMKKSSHHLEHNVSVNVQLPPKPSAPKVAMTDEKEMFKTIKVAKIKMPAVPNQNNPAPANDNYIESVQLVEDHIPSVNEATTVAQNVSISHHDNVAKPIELALNDTAKNVVNRQVKNATNLTSKNVLIKKEQSVSKPVATAKINKNNQLNAKGLYAVQLASFSKLSNAQGLVHKLHQKGYKANYVKTVSKRGVIYKVYAGHSPIKSDVTKLQTQLASVMQLNGLVVNTGVS